MRDRRILINSYAKQMLARLQEEFPHYTWCLMLIQGRELVVGKGVGGVVSGHDYESIIASMEVNND